MENTAVQQFREDKISNHIKKFHPMFQFHTSFNFCKAFKPCFPQTGRVKIRKYHRARQNIPRDPSIIQSGFQVSGKFMSDLPSPQNLFQR